MKTYYIRITYVLFIFYLNACATYNAQYNIERSVSEPEEEEISHALFLVGGAGNADVNSNSAVLEDLKKDLNKSSKNRTVLFLGNNIYAAGMPKKEAGNRTNSPITAGV